jgi:flagellar protein FlbD
VIDPWGAFSRPDANFHPLSLRNRARRADIFTGSSDQGEFVIELTKLNGRQIVLNSDLIECIEETPDTVITLTNNDKFVVKDRMNEIIDKMIRYRRAIAGLVEAERERKLAEV